MEKQILHEQFTTKPFFKMGIKEQEEAIQLICKSLALGATVTLGNPHCFGCGILLGSVTDVEWGNRPAGPVKKAALLIHFCPTCGPKWKKLWEA
ncbi:MAG: hypothetical protein PHF95_05760 [bacterium]|nr:hypothetical protein [bacterium]